jgi:quinol monooxygenase YgiN
MIVVAKVRPEKRKKFLQAMRSLQNERRKIKGIRGLTMNEEGDGGTFRLIDEWETEEDLGRYRKGESYRVFLGALKTLCVDANIRCEPSSIAGEEGSQKEKPYQFRK